MKDNRHSQAIPAVVLEQAQAKITEASGLLRPYLLALTPDERHDLPKMGPKTLNFVEKSHEYAHALQHLVPPYLDMSAFDSDFADAHGLWNLNNSLHRLAAEVLDTQTAAGSEAFQAALLFYNSVKVAANQDVLDAKTVCEELKLRFPSSRRKAADAPAE